MTPIEVLDTYEAQTENNLDKDEKETFSRDEVKAMTRLCFSAFRKAVLHGTFDLTVENKEGETVTVSDNDYNVFKFAGENGKQFLIMQFTSEDGTAITETELDSISKEISTALKNAKGIGGVLLLPTDCEMRMLTAKMHIPEMTDTVASDNNDKEDTIFDSVISIINSIRDDADRNNESG